MQGVICAHIDDFIFAGTELFIKNIIAPFREKLGLEVEKVFKYPELKLQQNQRDIYIDQNNFIESIQPITLTNKRKLRKGYSLKFIKSIELGC